MNQAPLEDKAPATWKDLEALFKEAIENIPPNLHPAQRIEITQQIIVSCLIDIIRMGKEREPTILLPGGRA